MITTRIRALIALAGLSFLTFGNPLPAQAVVLSTTPPKFELFGNPGDTVVERLKVRNEDPALAAEYQLDVKNFTADGDQGGVAFEEDPNAPTTSYSLASWVTMSPNRFVVEPGQEKIVTITIKIPREAEPGSHFASVQVRGVTDTPTAGTAAVESRVNTLILIRVSGNVSENIVLDSFTTTESYYQKGPISFDLRTKNEGNVHVQPSGTIIITDQFNKKVKEIPLKQATVLPGSARLATTTWDETKMVGRYTATLVATYGQGRQNLTATTSFWVVPLSLIVLVLGGILVLVLLITQRRLFRKLLHRLTAE